MRSFNMQSFMRDLELVGLLAVHDPHAALLAHTHTHTHAHSAAGGGGGKWGGAEPRAGAFVGEGGPCNSGSEAGAPSALRQALCADKQAMRRQTGDVSTNRPFPHTWCAPIMVWKSLGMPGRMYTPERLTRGTLRPWHKGQGRDRWAGIQFMNLVLGGYFCDSGPDCGVTRDHPRDACVDWGMIGRLGPHHVPSENSTSAGAGSVAMRSRASFSSMPRFAYASRMRSNVGWCSSSFAPGEGRRRSVMSGSRGAPVGRARRQGGCWASREAKAGASSTRWAWVEMVEMLGR